MKLLKELNEGRKWTTPAGVNITDEEIEKFWSYYEPDMSDDDKRTLASEEWSDKFTDEQVDSGEFDEFIEHALNVYDGAVEE